MNRMFLSIVLVFVVVGGLLIFQMTRQTSSAVLLPSELLSEQSAAKLARVKVGGKVAELVSYTLEPIELKFRIGDPGAESASSGLQNVPVVYNGLKPDMFAVGRDVIIEGEYKEGTLRAHKLLTQCPSKYEPPSADKRHN